MSSFTSALWIETLKARRSNVPGFTAIGFCLIPLACAFLMFVYKDPEFARSSGIISAKAELIGGSADWPTFMSMLAQALGIAGLVLFGIIFTWVFGREFVDGTLKDLLAVPVSRGAILLAKFVVAAAWSLGLAMLVYLVGMVAGVLVDMPLGAAGVIVGGSVTYWVSALLVIGVNTPIALAACLGRGYLLPMGIAILLLILGQVLAVIGWGHIYPWSVPGMYAAASPGLPAVGAGSYLIVLLTGLAGIVATLLWWRYADQNR